MCIKSNGKSGDLSRSWNRVYANLVFERGHFYYGYGESLIDYSHKVNKLGVGIKLTDWL